jgi:hypothetical protein
VEQQAEEQGEQQPQGELQADGSDLSKESSAGDSSRGTEKLLDLPIALRKGTRAATLKEIDRYGLVHNLGNYVSYEALSPSYKAFVASLQSIPIPTDWRATKQ